MEYSVGCYEKKLTCLRINITAHIEITVEDLNLHEIWPPSAKCHFWASVIPKRCSDGLTEQITNINSLRITHHIPSNSSNISNPTGGNNIFLHNSLSFLASLQAKLCCCFLPLGHYFTGYPPVYLLLCTILMLGLQYIWAFLRILTFLNHIFHANSSPVHKDSIPETRIQSPFHIVPHTWRYINTSNLILLS